MGKNISVSQGKGYTPNCYPTILKDGQHLPSVQPWALALLSSHVVFIYNTNISGGVFGVVSAVMVLTQMLRGNEGDFVFNIS